MDFGPSCSNEQAHLQPLVEPEQLGSVTHTQDPEGSSTGLQIRSSARVSKKMRLDLISSPTSNHLGAPDKKDGGKEDEKCDSKTPESKQGKTPDSKQAKSPDGKPRRRPWELWSQEDKDMFFEALNDLGKDFEAIQNYFTVKARKRGAGEHIIKNKDQIRHFYYRTWHKISKHLKFADGKISDVKKATQELYALINYGELRKKVGCVTEKTGMKLNQLIHKGFTQVRLKGKTIRVKTPLCRALRRLNQVDECQEDLKLPARVNVELRPRTNEAWAHVQASAHNPRVRTLVPLQKRLSTLLFYLARSWKPHQDKLHKQVVAHIETLEAPSDETAKNTSIEPLLRVAPRPGVSITLPSFNLSEYLTSSILSLNSYEERISSYLASAPAGRVKKGVKRQRNESQGDKKEEKKSSHGDKKTSGVDDKKAGAPEERWEDKRDRIMNNIEDNACDNNLEDLMAAQLNYSVANPFLPNQERDSNGEPLNPNEGKSGSQEDIISKVRSGWTIENVNAITIGELYLMFGADSRLQLDYWWDSPHETQAKTIQCSSTSGSPPDKTATITISDSSPEAMSKTWKQEKITQPAHGCVPVDNTVGAPVSLEPSISATLSTLLSIARLNLRKGRVECPCGHICGGAPTPRPPTFPFRPIRAEPHELPEVAPDLVDGVFRRPQQPSQRPIKPGSVDAFKQQLDNFYPRYCNRRGRAMRPKNVVVPRMLPLLPKAPNGTTYLPARVVMPVTTRMPIKVMSRNLDVMPPNPTVFVNAEVVVSSTSASGSADVATRNTAVSDVTICGGLNLSERISTQSPPHLDSEESALISSLPSLDTPVSSPPSISNLLDLSGHDDLSLSSAPSFVGKNWTPYPFSEHYKTLNGVYNCLLSRDLPLTTPPSSPSRVLADTQWLNSEVADFSLSSFLGHLESPIKLQDEPRASDVDPQLQCLISDNSLDFVNKFHDFIASADSGEK